MGKILKDLDAETVSLAIGTAVDLFQAGTEIMALLQEGREFDAFEMLEIIEKHDKAKEKARTRLMASIRERRDALN